MHCCNWLLLFLLFIYHFTAWNQPVVGHLVSHNSSDTPQFPNMIVLRLPSSPSVSSFFLSFFNLCFPHFSHTATHTDCPSTASLLQSRQSLVFSFEQKKPEVYGTKHKRERSLIRNQSTLITAQHCATQKCNVSHCVTLSLIILS